MKKKTKCLGAITIASAAVLVVGAKPVRQKIKARCSRRYIKKFVREHVKNSHYLMQTISRLSDHQAEKIASFIHSAMSKKEQWQAKGEDMNAFVRQVLSDIDTNSYVNVREPQY